MAGVLYRLGRLCAKRAIVVVAVWLGLAVVVHLVVWDVGAETSNDLSLPGTESQQATDLLTSRFPPQQNGSSPIVFHITKGKITDTATEQAVESSHKALSKAPHVASAPDPFANAASGLVSKDATTAFPPVLLDIPNGEVTEELADAILDTTAPARKAAWPPRSAWAWASTTRCSWSPSIATRWPAASTGRSRSPERSRPRAAPSCSPAAP
jgi:putative drug exporter of the RND superfamily